RTTLRSGIAQALPLSARAPRVRHAGYSSHATTGSSPAITVSLNHACRLVAAAKCFDGVAGRDHLPRSESFMDRREALRVIVAGGASVAAPSWLHDPGQRSAPLSRAIPS